MSPFVIESTFPPSLEDRPLLALIVVAAYWGGTLFLLQWIFAVITDMLAVPAGPRHPVTRVRRIKLALLTAALVMTVPRLVLVMGWQKLGSVGRETWSVATWAVLIPWAILLGYAWWLDREARPVEQVATLRWSITEVKPATGIEKMRGVMLVGIIMVIAFVTTFVRPEQPHAAVHFAVARSG